jgi:outer membrane protein assembly factor BamB
LLDAESGKVIWRKKVGSQGRGVLLGGNFALYASNTEECRFLDLVTGETRWTARAEEYCHALALGPGVVYYGSGAYRLKDGSALWTVEAPAQQWSAGPGFAVGVFAKNQLGAVDGASGKVLWTWTAPGGTGSAQIPLRQAPAIVNGKVVASVEEGMVAVLDAEDGKVLASRVLDTSEPDGRGRDLNCFPVIAGGLLLASSNGGRVFALRFPDEAASWTGNGGGPRRLSEAYEPDPVKLASAEPGCDFGGKEDEGE